MQITDEMIDKLAHLAKLQFNDMEKSAIKGDLEKMIGFVEKLNELDLDAVEPLMHMSESVNVLRDDVVQGSISREKALQNAPDTDGQYFRVPKVIRK
ncbi:MAG: Asp-tRNA(Asn)/Glu-tRNA(Gln) amidotransferase subunit GatC [Chitinophagaceae bacterium]|nr:Asp-tRNA(Asn)/Glu-tRNA(Gln) amidotransferase subunit GatC [Chitinophagaceae bacterium]